MVARSNEFVTLACCLLLHNHKKFTLWPFRVMSSRVCTAVCSRQCGPGKFENCILSTSYLNWYIYSIIYIVMINYDRLISVKWARTEVLKIVPKVYFSVTLVQEFCSARKLILLVDRRKRENEFCYKKPTSVTFWQKFVLILDWKKLFFEVNVAFQTKRIVHHECTKF